MRKILETDIPRIRELLERVFAVSEYKYIERLGGLTNHTYRVDLHNGETYLIRIPGEGTEKLINRADEKKSTQLACDLGIDAPMLYFGDTGEKVTCYITGAQTMCTQSFEHPDILRKAAEVMRVLHTSGVDTGVVFDVFDMAAGYETIIRDYAVDLFDDYEDVKVQVLRIRNHVAKHAETSPVPCHNDPLCENWVLDKDGKLYLIDWEYAGMNDGMWDLADVSIEAAMTEKQEQELLKFYFGREPSQNEWMRFYANKLYLDFLWALWGKTRVPFDGDDMEKYGLERYERLKQNLIRYEKALSIE